MQILMRWLFAVTTVTGLMVATAGAQSATPGPAGTVWTMPTPYPADNFHTANVRAFAAEIEQATAGALKLDIKPAGSLFKHNEIKRRVKAGDAPIGEILLSLHADENPIYGADSIPFLATSFDQAAKLYAVQRPTLEQRLAEEGLVLLYSVPWPPQGIYARKEIRSVGDLKGLKFRSYGPATKRIAELVGAEPVQVEVPDLKAAFEQGRVEVTITSGATGVQSKFWDFVTHYHDTQAWIPRNIVFAKATALAGLPAAEREAVLAAARAAETRGWAAAARETADRTDQLKASPLVVVAPSSELMAGLRSIGQTMGEEWGVGAGADGVAMLKAYREALTKTP
jgi:TRAP-type transport system periplasmic protein